MRKILLALFIIVALAIAMSCGSNPPTPPPIEPTGLHALSVAVDDYSVHQIPESVYICIPIRGSEKVNCIEPPPGSLLLIPNPKISD